MQFFRKFIDSTARDLQFVIDDLSTEDSSAVGVTWHLGMLKTILCLLPSFIPASTSYLFRFLFFQHD